MPQHTPLRRILGISNVVFFSSIYINITDRLFKNSLIYTTKTTPRNCLILSAQIVPLKNIILYLEFPREKIFFSFFLYGEFASPSCFYFFSFFSFFSFHCLIPSFCLALPTYCPPTPPVSGKLFYTLLYIISAHPSSYIFWKMKKKHTFFFPNPG